MFKLIELDLIIPEDMEPIEERNHPYGRFTQKVISRLQEEGLYEPNLMFRGFPRRKFSDAILTGSDLTEPRELDDTGYILPPDVLWFTTEKSFKGLENNVGEAVISAELCARDTWEPKEELAPSGLLIYRRVDLEVLNDIKFPRFGRRPYKIKPGSKPVCIVKCNRIKS